MCFVTRANGGSLGHLGDYDSITGNPEVGRG